MFEDTINYNKMGFDDYASFTAIPDYIGVFSQISVSI
jgi:hypothetical protein